MIERNRYCVWSYQRPAPNTSYREQWRGHAPMITEWRFAIRSGCGTYWDMSKGGSGYPTQEAAEQAARDYE